MLGLEAKSSYYVLESSSGSRFRIRVDFPRVWPHRRRVSHVLLQPSVLWWRNREHDEQKHVINRTAVGFRECKEVVRAWLLRRRNSKGERDKGYDGNDSELKRLPRVWGPVIIESTGRRENFQNRHLNAKRSIASESVVEDPNEDADRME